MDGDFNPETGEVIEGGRTMPPAIAAAIVAVKKQVKQLGADDRNEHGKYNFVSVDKFYATIGKLMADAGLALLIDETTAEVRSSDKTGNPWLFVQYDLTFMHEGGALSPPLRRSCALPISGPQAYGAAQSYIEKQFLRQIFKVPTGDRDADGTAQDEDGAKGLSGGRTGQGSAPAARTHPARQQAAPAPSEGRAEAVKRQREIAAMIDSSTSIPELDGIEPMPAWATLDRIIHEVEPKDVADRLMENLRIRIANQRATLMGGEGSFQA